MLLQRVANQEIVKNIKTMSANEQLTKHKDYENETTFAPYAHVAHGGSRCPGGKNRQGGAVNW